MSHKNCCCNDRTIVVSPYAQAPVHNHDGFGDGCWWWIIIILLFCCCGNNGFGNCGGCGNDGCGNNGFGNWWIIIILIFCCCGCGTGYGRY